MDRKSQKRKRDKPTSGDEEQDVQQPGPYRVSPNARTGYEIDRETGESIVKFYPLLDIKQPLAIAPTSSSSSTASQMDTSELEESVASQQETIDNNNNEEKDIESTHETKHDDAATADTLLMRAEETGDLETQVRLKISKKPKIASQDSKRKPLSDETTVSAPTKKAPDLETVRLLVKNFNDDACKKKAAVTKKALRDMLNKHFVGCDFKKQDPLRKMLKTAMNEIFDSD